MAAVSRRIHPNELTVNSDGNSLVKSIAICTNEGWDLAKLVDLEVIRRDALGRIGINNL